jgi:hypothetical protein
MIDQTRKTVILNLGILSMFATASANAQTKPQTLTQPRQIVIFVDRAEKGLRFNIRAEDYGKGDANYLLAELKLHEGVECQIIPIIDDRAPMSALTQVSEMIINAGFKDIRPFIYWHKTGRMAQIDFGPPIKYTQNADKIYRRMAVR